MAVVPVEMIFFHHFCAVSWTKNFCGSTLCFLMDQYFSWKDNFLLSKYLCSTNRMACLCCCCYLCNPLSRAALFTPVLQGEEGSVHGGGRGQRSAGHRAASKLTKAVSSQAAAACHPLMPSDFYLSLGNSFKGLDVSIVLVTACVCCVVTGRGLKMTLSVK